jgi:hypothetical protein
MNVVILVGFAMAVMVTLVLTLVGMEFVSMGKEPMFLMENPCVQEIVVHLLVRMNLDVLVNVEMEFWKAGKSVMMETWETTMDAILTARLKLDVIVI